MNTITEWEYKRIEIEEPGGREEKRTLWELGTDGWELVSYQCHPDKKSPRAFAIFKRPHKPVGCEDCGKPYKEFLLDVTLPDEQWELVSGHSDGGGLLCAACIVERAAKLPGIIVAKMTLEIADSTPN